MVHTQWVTRREHTCVLGGIHAHALRCRHACYILNLHKAHRPATKSHASDRALVRKHKRARSGKHSIVYIHTPALPSHASHQHLQNVPPPVAPAPSSPSLPQALGHTPVSRKRQHRPGDGASPPAPSPDGEPGAEPGPASLPIQQVLQVLRAVLLGAGAEPGCPGCRQEVLWRNGRPLHPKQERRVRSWGGHSPASSQLHSMPGLRVTLGSHCPKLPASPFIPSCPSQLTFPILPSPCHLRAWHRVHGEEQSSRSLFFPCLLPFPLPETRFPLSEA